ncbi:MAG: class I SAM-dependent methyltransferase [Candidatus Rifleibacteriota bacterium]
MIYQKFKETIKKIRSVITSFFFKQTMQHLEDIRSHELTVILKILQLEGRQIGKVLEIGAGAGWQARSLAAQGFQVSAIDVETSYNCTNSVWPVIQYDGKKIPFDGNTFDIIFSSNVLEHIPHSFEFQKEIHRVSKTNALVIHILPSSSWRFWTNLTHLLKYWTFPRAHGEHSNNPLMEILFFSRKWWNRFFCRTGWVVLRQESNHLFYTGCSIMDSMLSIKSRISLSCILGSSCNIFVLKKSQSL